MGTAYGDQSISVSTNTLNLHIPPSPRTIHETGKPVAANHKTGFTTSGWKSVGGWTPQAHCNLNSTLLHILNIKQIGPQLQLILLMMADMIICRASEKEEKI